MKHDTTLSKGERTRRVIIDAANALFYQRGYSNTSFSDIVERAGVQRGNIYHYFKTKEEVLGAVIQQRESQYRKLLADWDLEYANPRARLRRFVDMVANNSNDLARYGCPIGTLGAELGKASCKPRKATRILFDVFRGWLTEQFRQLGRSSDAESLALRLLSQTEGISMIAHVYNDASLITGEIRALESWIDRL